MEPQAQSILKLVAENARPSIVITLLLGYIVTTIIYRILFHPLRKIPGPFIAKFTELWRTQKYFAGNWHVDILDLHRKYGPVVRLSPNEVSFVDKDALTAIYGHANGTKKTSWYDVWKSRGVDDSFFNVTNPQTHSFLRKRVTSVYTMTSILSMEPQIQSVADALWPRLAAFARSNQPLPLHDWTPFFAFDVVGTIALGAPMGFITGGSDSEGIIAAIHKFFFWSANLGHLPGQQRLLFHPLTQGLLTAVGIKTEGADYLKGWMFSQLQRRRARGPPPDTAKADMLDFFLAMQSRDGSAAPASAVLVEAANIIWAGADTTAIAIRAVLGQLMQHPDSMQRLQAEIDGAYALHRLSDAPGGGGVPFAIAEKLPFLTACVREALRLHPSIQYQLPREAPAQGIRVAGYYIPATATLSISPLAQNRCIDVFGTDAEEWRPERWIVGEGADEAGVREMGKFDTTFGYGSRTCVGRNLAMVEIYKFVAQLLHQFDIALVNKERPWVTKSMWFSDQGDMFVKIKERSI